MREGKVHIGTSGWSYKHWKGIFYDDKLKPTEYLAYYASLFNTSEINTSFYHLPKQATVEGWVKKVPKGFTFCPKISRYLTHMKKLHEPEESLARFFEAFKPMQKMMGPVLVQLPPTLKFNAEVAEAFYIASKKYNKKNGFAIEVRHPSWLGDNSLALMKKYNIAFVISQSFNKFPYAEIVTTKNIYLRLHGPNALYASAYPSQQLEQYAAMLKNWQKNGHTIWCYFNNDIHGFAYQNALELSGMLQ